MTDTWVTALVVGLALAVAGGMFLLGLLDPLTARLGVRNVARHRRQTAIVIVGLLAGTAVVGASLVTGDSLGFGLRKTAIDAVGETDVIVTIPGNLYVPEEVFDAMVAPPHPGTWESGSALVVEGAAVEHVAEDLYEPTAVVLGFDPEEDAAFGPFVDAATRAEAYGRDLGADDVYVNARLADKLGIEAGDELRLTYREPFVPFVPQVTWMNGTLVSANAAPDGSGGYVYTHAPNDEYVTTVQVPAGSVGIFAVATWVDPEGNTDLDLELVSPDGRVFRATNGTVVDADGTPLPIPLPPPVANQTGGPENPAVLFVDEADVTGGTWTFRVHGKNAQNQFYVSLAAALVPEYDIARAFAFFDDLQERFGEDGLAEALDPRNVQGDAQNTTVTVRRVVAMEGRGVFFGADAVFMRKDTAQTLYGVQGRENWLRISNVGDPESGLVGTDTTVQHLEERVQALRAAPGDLPPGALQELQVRPLKQEFVQATEEAASLFTQFLTLIGTFTLVAGVMLIVNIFSMLAEERRHELGIARAVGLTRGRLVRAFLFEGSLYTVAASALGVLAGMGLAAFLVWGINSLAPPDGIFRVPFRAEPISLAVAFCTGALLTFLTVVVASVRASRMNIVRAIRDLDAGAEARAGWLSRVLLLGGAVGVTVIGIVFGSYLALVMGPPLVGFALVPVFRARPGTRHAARLAMAAATIAIVYTLLSFVVFPGQEGLERDISTVARGVLLVIAATILFVSTSAIPRGVAALLRRSRRLAPVAAVATTYPLHRRFRTGLTVSMYALVLFVIVVFSVFFTMFTPDVARETGGYEVVASSQVAREDLQGVAGVAALAGGPDDPFAGVRSWSMLVEHFEFGDGRILLDGEPPEGFGAGSARFIGFDESFAAENGFPLAQWDPALGDTEEEVYRAVARDPELVLVSYALVANLSAPEGISHGPGTVLTINTTGGRQDHVIAGVMEQTFFGGVWMQKAEVESLFPDLEGLYFFDLEAGVDPGDAAKRIERAFRPIGMDADDVDEETAELQAESRRVYQLFQAYLGLGLIVGVASIGIVTSRAVLERRREIGMLKSVGFTRGMVAAAFLTEVLFMLAVAALIGLGMGLAVARAVWLGQLQNVPGVQWIVPWARILQMLGLALVATVLATLWPAYRASRVPAAEALRTIE